MAARSFRILGIALLLAVGSSAHATITSAYTPDTYTGSGTTGPFTINFNFRTLDELKVTLITIATGAEATLTRCSGAGTVGCHYNATLPTINLSRKGTVTTLSNVAATHQIKIELVVPVTQTTSFTTTGTYSALAHERAFDKLTQMVQQTRAAAGTSGDSAVATHVGLADPHSQYAKLGGRAGGQTLIGGTTSGNNLVLKTNTSNDGDLIIGNAGTFVYDESTARVGIGDATPDYRLDLEGGDAQLGTKLLLSSAGLHDIAATSDTGTLSIVGGLESTTQPWGAIRVHAKNHATRANDIDVYSDDFLWLDPDGNTMMQLDNTGVGTGELELRAGSKLGIGDSTPDAILDVEGDALIGSTAGGKLWLDSYTITTLDDDPLNELTLSAATAGGVILDAGWITLYGEGHASFPGAVKVHGDEQFLTLINGTERLEVNATGVEVTGAGAFTGAVTGLRKVITSATVGAAYTVVAPDDCGATIYVGTNNAIVTVPNAAPVNLGCAVKIINSGADGTAINVAPHASDGIEGSCTGVTGAGAATVVEFTGTVAKQIQNGANANKGDTVIVESDGSAAWWAGSCVGEWASQP